jgi:hypothetical protein
LFDVPGRRDHPARHFFRTIKIWGRESPPVQAEWSANLQLIDPVVAKDSQFRASKPRSVDDRSVADYQE